MACNGHPPHSAQALLRCDTCLQDAAPCEVMSVDTTSYDLAKTPGVPVRALFAQHGLSVGVRKALADAGFLSVELFAAAGNDPSESSKRIASHIDMAMPQDAIQKDLELLKLAAICSACSTMTTNKATLEAKYSDDPAKIPVVPEHERTLMRVAWKAAHPELDLHEHNEPHPRLVDRVKRDWVVHGRVLHYALTDIRVRADVILYKSAAAVTLEDLVRTVKEEVPQHKVDSEEQVLDRLHALFVVLEYLKIFSPVDFRTVGLRYLAELRKFRRSHGGVHMLVMADTLIRARLRRTSSKSPPPSSPTPS